MWEVDCGIPVENMEDWNKINSALEPLGNVSAAGTGFGYRDIQFGCNTEEEAKALAKKVEDAIKELGYEVGNSADRKAYVSYYEQEEEEDAEC